MEKRVKSFTPKNMFGDVYKYVETIMWDNMHKGDSFLKFTLNDAFWRWYEEKDELVAAFDFTKNEDEITVKELGQTMKEAGDNIVCLMMFIKLIMKKLGVVPKEQKRIDASSWTPT